MTKSKMSSQARLDLERQDSDDDVTLDEITGSPIQRKPTLQQRLNRYHPYTQYCSIVLLGVVMLLVAITLLVEVVLPVFLTASTDTSLSKKQLVIPSSTNRLSVLLEGWYHVELSDGNISQTNSNTSSQQESESASMCLMGVGGNTVSAVDEEPLYPAINRIYPDWADGVIAAENWDTSIRTFEVEPNHTTLENASGVVFNVETVSQALPEDLVKPRLSQQELLFAAKEEAGKFYRPEAFAPPNVTLEVLSNVSEGNLIFAGGQGFVAACMMAFAYHLPLALRPDDLWTVITSGFAYHVDQHAEELRSNFVNHTGKITLEIREDSMRQGASSAEQWESLIFPKFTEKIGENMNNTEVFELLSQSKFSTSTPTSHAASEIVLMSAMKGYFEYSLTTSCGIPHIQLDGTLEDWQSLRNQTEKLGSWMMQNHTHGDLWITNVVLPILDQFLDSYNGKVSHCFWQNIVKFRNTNARSGDFDFLSGWLPNLFPYINRGDGVIVENRSLRHWSVSALGDSIGPKPSQLPIQMSSAPVLWTYFEEKFNLHFHAGFRGVHQDDRGDGMLRPVLGWYVSYDP